MVSKVTCDEKYVLEGNGPKVALLDLVQRRTLPSLNERGCEVTVYPAGTKQKRSLLLTGRHYVVTDLEIRRNAYLLSKRSRNYMILIFLFCNLSWTSAYGTCKGAKTYKMKYGHRGGNHPVKDLKTGQSIYFFTEPWLCS